MLVAGEVMPTAMMYNALIKRLSRREQRKAQPKCKQTTVLAKAEV
jgi:hypothetical protein